MDLQDQLPPLLKKANIARIEGDRLLIGDRRAYPWKLAFFPCETVGDIVMAIRSMVTQGGGPLQVSLTTMRFVARQIAEGRVADHPNTFFDAAKKLSGARPTNTTMARTLQSLVGELSKWYHCTGIKDVHGNDIVAYVDDVVDGIEKHFDADYDTMGTLGASCLADGDGILTTCFAEHSFLLTLAKARAQGKELTVYVPETRPYLQGARLTAPSLHEMGIEAYVITDGMGAHFMQEGVIHQYMTAADLVAMDGTVVNKVGTLANAIGAAYYDIPYYAFAMSPDPTKRTRSAIVMEERDGSEVLKLLDTKTTLEHVVGRYPAFDIIDASLVRGIITPKGLLRPDEIGPQYLEN